MQSQLICPTMHNKWYFLIIVVLCPQVDHPVILPSSVSSLLQSCPRLAPHFTFTPVPTPQQAGEGEGEEAAAPLTPPLAKFVNVDPFQVSSKSVELAPPKQLSAGAGEEQSNGCCGSGPPRQQQQSSSCCGNGPPPAKKTCCGSGGTTGEAAADAGGKCCSDA